MTLKKSAWAIPRKVEYHVFERLVKDAERVLGKRICKDGSMLTPPSQGSDDRQWADHILQLSWPIVQVGPGWYVNGTVQWSKDKRYYKGKISHILPTKVAFIKVSHFSMNGENWIATTGYHKVALHKLSEGIDD